ncbi:glycosyltransferase family protein [Proteus mirabilis]|uniref:hypothetical protein n=1 Tax=Proteus mirabilis TaxID=584 RepID=UPI00391AD098
MNNFSILLSVYNGENPIFLDNALSSLYEYQKIKPTEIVVVIDGPINKSLLAIIDNYKNKLNKFNKSYKSK